MNKHASSRRAVLSRMILPAVLVTTASAAEITWNGSQNPFTLNVNVVYGEGLHEGFVDAADNETTPIESANIGPDNGQGAGFSLGLRMAQTTVFGATDWANNRTWIYSGEAFTGPNGVISFAANNDDTDWLKLNGVVVLNDNGWNTANAVTVTGLTPNSWVPFEYRVSDTGAGGAGPSAQNNPAGAAGWNNTTGAVMSFNNENNSLNANDYIGGANDVGKPTELANGTPELFRYFIGDSAGGDNIHVTTSSTATLTGTGSQISEGQLTFEAGATPVTLTFNNSDAVQRTLAATKTTFANANGATTIFAGSGNVRVGEATDGTFTGVTVVKDGGTGDLIFDTEANDLNGTTLRANNGRISIQGNGYDPISTLTTPIQISNGAGIVRFGGTPTGTASTNRTTFASGLAVNESGTLEHVTPREDLLAGPVTIAATKTLNGKIDGGTIRLTGAVSGGNIDKTGAGTLRIEGTTQLDSVTVSAGTLALNGNTTLTNTPVIASGGTLALTGVGTTYTFPGPMVVSTGGALRTYAAPIGTRQTNLTGGTLILDGEHGLTGEYWNIAPPNVANANPGWGPTTLVQGVGTSSGTNTPGSGDFTGFQSGFTALGPAPIIVNTTDNGVTSFNFPSVDTAPFEVYGVPYTDNIQARWTGKFYAPVAGIYAMSTTSDDGSEIFIDGASVVDNNMYQPMTNRGGTVFLQPGLHDITMGFYEGGGGAGIQVLVTPPGGTSQFLNNSMLFTTAGNNTFNNPIDIQQDSTIRTDDYEAIAADLTIQPGKKLTTEGNTLTATLLKMRTSGTYTINTSGASNVLVASKIDDNSGAAALTINKIGAGVFALDNTTTDQLTNAGSVINLNEGSLGILLQSGGKSPTGNAAINFNGGGFVLSSKGGDQTYPLPPSGFGGTAPIVQARQIGSGVAGPVSITLGGNLKIPAAQTLGLKTSGAYTLLIQGTPDLSGGVGTLSINGGQIATTTPTAINGLNLAFNATEPTTLRVVSNAVTLNSLSSLGKVPGNLVVGTGTGKATLTINGALTTSYNGALNQVTGTTAALIKDGTGKLTISGPSTFSDGVTINAGTLNTNNAALGSGPITLAGGILQSSRSLSGLVGEYWDNTVGGDGGAMGGFGSDLATFDAYFTGKGSPIVSALTSTGGRTNLKFSDGVGLEGGGPDTATFADQGFNATNNMAVRLSGSIFIRQPGDYSFTTRSDDGSVVFIDGVKVVDNNLYQGMTTLTGAPITLTFGAHQISVGFYEGGGGSGLEVRYTPPGGQDQFISNQVLGGLHTTNAVIVTAPSTIDPDGGSIDLGALTLPPAIALTGLDGDINFSNTVLTGAGGNTYAINKTTGVLNLGAIADGGSAVVVNKTGNGTLLFATPTAAQFTNAATQINVNAGSVAAVGGGAINPLGAATVNLNSGGLILSSSAATASFPNTVNITGASSIGAGNLGGGAIDGASVTLAKPLTIAGGASLALKATNDYILNLPAVSGSGDLSVTQGTVNAGAGVTVGAVTVSGSNPTFPAIVGGVLNVSGNFTATTIGVGNLGAIRTTGPGGTIAAPGGITVNATGEIQGNGGTINGPVNLAGGSIRAQSGITDFGSNAISGTGPSVMNNALHGVLQITDGLQANLDPGILGTQVRNPEASINLTTPVDIVNDAQGDGKFSTLFNSNAAGPIFTAGFFGRLTAPENGTYQFQVTNVDDHAGFWVDLDRNGVFESNGSAGSELISSRDCCGGGPVGDATLVAGETYNVAFGVQDTGGDSGLTVNFKRPSDAGLALVNPGAANQANLWSTSAANNGGAGVIIEAGAELRARRLNAATVANLTGAGAKLRLDSGSAVTDTVDGLSVVIDLGGSATLELGANNTLNVGSFSVAPNNKLVKIGAGTLTAASQSIGQGGILQVDGGTVNLNGTGGAFSGIGGAIGGDVTVNNTGSVNVNGALSGVVTVNQGGALRGTGTIGAVNVAIDGLVSPGGGAGTLNSGNVNFAPGANVLLELFNSTTADRFNVAGTVTLDQSDLILTYLAGYSIAAGDKFFIVNNDDVDPVVGTFAGLPDGSTVSPALGGSFRIDYDGDFGTGATSGGNDVVLTALVSVPEPSALLALLGGSGMLVGLRRFRRA